MLRLLMIDDRVCKISNTISAGVFRQRTFDGLMSNRGKRELPRNRVVTHRHLLINNGIRGIFINFKNLIQTHQLAHSDVLLRIGW